MGPLKFLCCASAFGGVCFFASACLRWLVAGNGALAPRRFGATVAAAMWSRQRALRRNENGGFRDEASGLRETCGAAVPEAELPLVSNMWARGGALASAACLGPLALTSCWCGWRCGSCCAVCVEASPGMAGIRALAQCSGGMPHAHSARISFCMSEFVPEQKSAR